MAMDRVTFWQKGDWKDTTNWLTKNRRLKFDAILKEYMDEGVRALSEATPVDTGKTADSWEAHIEDGNGYVRVVWNNTNVNHYINIALILQYGHGTRNGGYVQGRDYINPAIQPVFDKMAEMAWKKVMSSNE